MDKEALLSQMDTQAKKYINSWQDIFDTLNRIYALAMETQDNLAFTLALVYHRAFARATELLPEEGDCLPIALQMNAVIVDELLMDPEITQEMQADALARALRAMERASGQAQEADFEPKIDNTVAKKPILH